MVSEAPLPPVPRRKSTSSSPGLASDLDQPSQRQKTYEKKTSGRVVKMPISDDEDDDIDDDEDEDFFEAGATANAIANDPEEDESDFDMVGSKFKKPASNKKPPVHPKSKGSESTTKPKKQAAPRAEKFVLDGDDTVNRRAALGLRTRKTTTLKVDDSSDDFLDEDSDEPKKKARPSQITEKPGAKGRKKKKTAAVADSDIDSTGGRSLGKRGNSKYRSSSVDLDSASDLDFEALGNEGELSPQNEPRSVEKILARRIKMVDPEVENKKKGFNKDDNKPPAKNDEKVDLPKGQTMQIDANEIGSSNASVGVTDGEKGPSISDAQEVLDIKEEKNTNPPREGSAMDVEKKYPQDEKKSENVTPDTEVEENNQMNVVKEPQPGETTADGDKEDVAKVSSTDKAISSTNDLKPKEKVGNSIIKKGDSYSSSASRMRHFAANKQKPKPGVPIVYEYLVKWKNLSFIHCEWVNEEVILSQSHGKARIMRFNKQEELKELRRDEDADEDEDPIAEDFVTVDRILAESNTDDGELYYLVKWRSLPYAEATWELAKDVSDDQKIEEFHSRNIMPLASELTTPPRPDPSSFKELERPEFKNGGMLREYQVEGYNWLISCWYKRQGSILADEMGLGKTIQSVSFCHFLFSIRKCKGPFLIIAPLSTLGHWQREFENWTWMNCIVYHGNADSRNLIQEYEWSYPDQKNKKGPPYKWHVLVTTYETILQEANKLRAIKWNAMIIDEAHRLKNRASRLVDELRTFHSEHRILLTGTPIQNNTVEVWALLNFLHPEHFNSEEEFAREFGVMESSESVDKLKELLRPYILRRLKEDVEKSIPPKEETIISVELTRIQKKWYKAMLEQNFSFLDKGVKASNVGNLRNIVMELRKCCNHPYLIKGVEQIETMNLNLTEEGLLQNLIEASGKLVLVDKLLNKLKENGHKVLIFSQMIRVLDILEDYLLHKRWGYERIDGRVRGNDRQQSIDRFSKENSEKFVFLLCTRAGGQGINLTVADTVIIYDSDWNPQNDIQAQARCHRIGQQKDVKVYRLITRATYEQDMFDRSSKKLGLDQAILQNMGYESLEKTKNNEGFAGLKREDIDALLKKGAYDVFNDDDSAADAFTAEDIDNILERRTTLIRTGGEAKGPSAFSKASFAVNSEKKDQIDLDDPDFWKKIMPTAAVAPDPLLIREPRTRRQTQRFQPGAFEDSDDEEMGGYSSDEVIMGDDPTGKKNFNKGERQRLQRGLMVYGWKRWLEIYDFVDLGGRRSLDEIVQFERNLTRLAALTVAGAAKNTHEALEELKTRHKFIEEAFRPHVVLEMVEKPEKPIVKSVTETEILVKDEKVKEEPVEVSKEGQPVGKKIETQDSTLDDVKMKPGIETSVKEEMTLDAAKGNGSDARAEDDPGERGDVKAESQGEGKENKYADDPPLVRDTMMIRETDIVLPEPLAIEPVLQTDDYKAYFQRNGGHIIERLELLHDVEMLAVAGALEDGTEVPVVGASGTQSVGEWWTADFDRNLIKGTHKYGFGNYTPMRLDPELCFLGRTEPVAEYLEGKDHKAMALIDPEEMMARVWPSVQVLNVRVKKLVKAYHRMRRKAEKLAKEEEEKEKVREQKEQRRIAKQLEKEKAEQEKERKVMMANLQWTKKERQDFSKYFSAVGDVPADIIKEPFEIRPNWGRVKERIGLARKAPEVIKDYSEEYIRMCLQILEEDGTVTHFSSQVLEDSKVTYPIAKKWKQRHTLLNKLRTDVILKMSEESIKADIEQLGPISRRDSGPHQKWWLDNIIAYDISLLHAVACHGFDVVSIALDPNHPFREACEQAASDHKKDLKIRLEEEGAQVENQSDPEPVDPDDDSLTAQEVVNFFPREKAIVSRVLTLYDMLTGVREEPMELEIIEQEEIKPESMLRGSSQGSSYTYREVKNNTLDYGYTYAFESVSFSRLSKHLLKALKTFKKSGSFNSNPRNATLDLPDWNMSEITFDIQPDEVSDSETWPSTKKRKYSSFSGMSPQSGNRAYSNVGSDNEILRPPSPDQKKVRRCTRAPRDSKPKESMLHKIERNPDGSVKFPLKLGVLVVETLGKVEWRKPKFHTERAIYPIGFRAHRHYISMKNVDQICKYTCEILEDEESDGPIFRVTCSEMEDHPFDDQSPSGCWTKIMKIIRERTPDDRKRLHTTVSGPEYFGLANVAVQELIQALPDVEKCEKYTMKTFKQKKR